MHPSRMSLLLMERRQASRVAVNRPGKLLFGGREVTCVVNDLSEGGAGLTVAIGDLPLDFALLIEGDVSSRECKIAWAEGQRLGVQFK